MGAIFGLVLGTILGWVVRGKREKLAKWFRNLVRDKVK